MVLQVTPEQMAIYKRTARERQARDEQAMRVRREFALSCARQAAQLLKERFGAKRVILFGSLAHGAWFHAGSDIDLATEGIKPGNYFSAWGALEDSVLDFEIDLVEIEHASERLRQSIEQGIEL